MGDICDDASDLSEAFLAMSLKNARVQKPQRPPTGFCFNCEAPVTGEKRYCNSECSNEHEAYLKRKRGMFYDGAT